MDQSNKYAPMNFIEWKKYSWFMWNIISICSIIIGYTYEQIGQSVLILIINDMAAWIRLIALIILFILLTALPDILEYHYEISKINKK